MLGLGKCLAVFLAIWTTIDCRLPASVRPTSYTLKLNLSSGLGGSPTAKFRGSVSILFNLTETLSNNAFSLHASNGLLVRNSSLLFHTNYGNVQPEHKLEQNMTAGTVTVAVMAPTEPGRYTLALDFEGEFQPDLSGFYRASYMDNGTKRWMASTQFESSSARKAFPCFDDPRMRAKLSLAVVLPTNLHAVSNTPVLNTTYNTDGSKTIRFQDSPAMPTYLFGWYIGDGTFGELASLSVKGIRYGIHGRTSLKGEEAYALEAAPKVIEQMETFTGVPYNNAGITKMDQVAVPDFNAGAMENWGFVTYREFYILLNQTLSTVGDKQRSLLVISHEFAHQWFGDSVTLDWWSYTWLNEAFARYFQYFVANKIEPSWKLEEQFLTDVFQLSMASDYDSHPLSNMKTETVTEIEDNFDVITYSKGASILRMFSHILGEVGFKQWLSKYLTTVISKGRVATPDDLWAALPDPNLAAPFKTWTEVGDHPVVHVTGSASQGLRMTQFKEAVNGSRLASKLQIPISVVTFSGPVKFGIASHSRAELSINGTTQPNGTEYFWMRSNDTAVVNLNVIQPQRDWYLVSANATGYYRVLYDEANWNALSAAIYMSEIPVVSRAQLISDALNLMASGYLAPATAWSFAEFLKVENDLIVWKSALMAFGRIRDVVAGWKNATDVLATRVGNFLDQAFEPEDLYSLSPQNHSVLILKSYKASQVCYYRTKLCQALRDFPSSHQSEIVKLDRQLDGALLCELVKSDPWMWTTLLQMYHNATSPSVKRRYLSSLSCTTNSTHQQELLNYVLDPSVIPRQDYGIVVAVSEVENGSRSVMEFIKRNGTQLARYWSNKEHVKRTLSSVARKLHTPKMLDELDEILQSTDLGLSIEESNAIISKARRAYEERSMVAARICRALGVVCNAPEDSKGAAISSVSNVFLTSTLTIICLVFWL